LLLTAAAAAAAACDAHVSCTYSASGPKSRNVRNAFDTHDTKRKRNVPCNPGAVYSLYGGNATDLSHAHVHCTVLSRACTCPHKLFSCNCSCNTHALQRRKGLQPRPSIGIEAPSSITHHACPRSTNPTSPSHISFIQPCWRLQSTTSNNMRHTAQSSEHTQMHFSMQLSSLPGIYLQAPAVAVQLHSTRHAPSKHHYHTTSHNLTGTPSAQLSTRSDTHL
jgi:hypothetical protein